MLEILNATIWPMLLLGLLAIVLFVRQRLVTAAHRADTGHYRKIVEHVGEGILVVDAASGRLIEVNPVLLRKLSYSAAEVASLHIGDVLIDVDLHEPQPPGAAAGPTTLARTTREVMQRGRDGSLVPVDVSATALEVAGRPAICYVIRDATPRKLREKDLRASRFVAERRADYLTRRDALTGLANRQAFATDLRNVIANAQDGMLAVLLLDLDHFSSLNDTLGAKVGDAVLLETARRLREVIGSRGLIARVGNDEFAVTLPPPTDPDTAGRMALEVQAALAASMQCFAYEINLTSNIGISMCESHEAEADMLLSQADLALSSAKSQGRDNVALFNSRMDRDMRRRLDILLSLRHALQRDELRIRYQPIVDIESRQLLSLEALVRWKHPRLGMISPAEFIPAAEQSGLIAGLGEQVLRLVCEQAVRWKESGAVLVPIAVNVSPQQFQRRSVAKLFENILAETGMAAGDLTIEITESSLMQGAERYWSELQALRAMGVRIVVDDFGTGYSSLSYLKYLPLDALKIDRAFVANVHTNATDEAIVAAIIAMARSLELKVVAEGVESPSQLAVLAKHGCQMAQGFYFGPPMTAEAVRSLMREIERRASFTDTLRLRVCGSASASDTGTYAALEH